MVSAAAALHVCVWLFGSAALLVALALLVGRLEAFMNEGTSAAAAAGARRAASGGTASSTARKPGGAVRRRQGDTLA